MATSLSDDSHSRDRFRFHLNMSFSSQKEKETFQSRFDAAKVLLVPGVKWNTTVSLLNALLDHALTQPESVPASKTFSSGNEMKLDSSKYVL